MNRLYMGRQRALPTLALALCTLATTASAQHPWVPMFEGKLWPGPTPVSDDFGRVALRGDLLVVGAAGGGQPGNQTGEVYLYRWGVGGWQLGQLLVPPDAADYDAFGGAVAVDGDTLLVGAPYHDAFADAAGAVYVYREVGGTWVPEAKLHAPAPAAGDGFGGQVALEGNRALIAAGQRDTAAKDAGAAFVFERGGVTWVPVAELVAPDAQAFDRLGSVALEGDTAVAGGGSAEYVQVFERLSGVWRPVQKLTVPTISAGSGFGGSLALDQGTLLVGAWLAKDAGIPTGEAYAFVKGALGFHLQGKLPVSGAQGGAHIGHSVAIQGDLAIVGADGMDFGKGAALVFTREGDVWSEVARMQPYLPGIPNPAFGTHVALDGQRCAVGAPWDDPLGYSGSGTAQVFRLQPTVEPYCAGGLNSAGKAAHIDVLGSSSVSANDFSVAVVDAVPGQVSLFFYGIPGPQVPFANGFLCIAGGGPVARLLPAMGIGPDGSVVRKVDFTKPPANSAGTVLKPGSIWGFQLWYRDPAAAGAGSNLSDATAVFFNF